MTDTVVKAKRQQRGRTRTGCATCRLRRVKCDEIKPICLRCQKAERVCDWGELVTTRATPTLNLNPNEIYLLSRKTGTLQEQRGFDFFLHCTADSLTGLFPSEFWQKNILQAGSDLPSLRHAIIAIGAVHEQFVSGHVLDESFAHAQYDKSVRELQKDMAAGKCTPEIALVCCALYVSYDSLKGWTSQAIMHLQNGVKILQSLQQSSGELAISGSFTYLRSLMARLASQINSDMQDPNDPTGDRENTLNMLADIFGRLLQMHPLEPALKFESLEEARDHLYSFINAHLYHYYLRSLYYGCDNAEHLQPHIETIQEPILIAMQSWDMTFAAYERLHYRTMTPAQRSAAALLRVHYQVMRALIVGQLIPDEQGRDSYETTEVFKAFDTSFTEALILVENLLTASSSIDQKSASHSSFYADVGVVPMLFFIAMKCTDKRLRQRAADILRSSHRREGTWDSITCLGIIDYAIASEEMAQYNESMSKLSITEIYESSAENSPTADGTSPTGSCDTALIGIQDVKARRYIEAGKEEAKRLRKRSRGDVKHALLYL